MAVEGLLASILKIAAALGVGVPLLVYLAQDSLIFMRQPLSESRRAEIAKRFPAVVERTIEAADGTRLHAWQVRAPAGAPLVIYFGGNAEDVSWMLDAIGDPQRGATPGVGWLLVSYRGYGGSGGSPSERALVADALQWFDHALEAPEHRAERVFAFGRSLGSGVVVQLAAQRPVHAVILATPYESLAAVAKRYYPFLPVDWLLRHRFDSLERAPRINTPLLVLVAEHDEVIPPVHAERLYEAWGGPKRKVVLSGARHNDIDGAARFWPGIREFLGEAER